MSLNKRLSKSVSLLMTAVLVVSSVFSSASLADSFIQDEPYITYEEDTEDKGRVVVSMGDSFSAGEGISPFYGNRYSDFIEIQDWLAHRSQRAWSGMLYMDKNNKFDMLSKHKASYNKSFNENDNTAWYFVAASGAETRHLYEKQEKIFNIGPVAFRTYLETQLNVLDQLNKDKVVPDYITMSLGGNDVDFVPVVSQAATSLGFLDPNAIEAKLNHAMKKLTRGDGGQESIRNKLRKAYKDINDKVAVKGGKQPCIIVAGYPRLLNENIKNVSHNYGFGVTSGVGEVALYNLLLFDPVEAQKVNDCVDYFDETIKQIVYQSKWRDGLDIEFVDVRTAFNGHEVYSSDPWINGADIFPHDDDLITYVVTEKLSEEFKKQNGENNEADQDKSWLEKIKDNIEYHPSGASIHPNIKGAYYGYARCVQEVIDKREAARNKPTSTPTPAPEVKPSESLPSNSESTPDEAPRDPVTGYKVVKFGFNNGLDIEWLVLEEDENEMFLLSKDILVSKAYGLEQEEREKHKDDPDFNNTWRWSSLRKWLNNEFYERAFTDKEKARIIPTECLNVPNRVTGACGGDSTEDKVFLLSVHEEELYFGQFQDKAERAIAKDCNGVVYSWWLRSPGLYGDQAAFVDTEGYLSDLGDYVSIDTYGVRPAMWIKKETAKGTEPEPETETTATTTESTQPVDSRGIAVLDSPNSTVIEVDGEKHDFKIPMIRIPDVPVSLTNKSIEKQVNKFNIHKTKQYLNSPYDSHYRYHITEKTITIIVDFWRINGGEDERDELIFNIDIKTGDLMSGSQVVKLFGMTDKQFFSKVKTCYKNFYMLESKNRENDPKAKKMAKTLYDKNLKLISYKYIVPFVDENGRLMFAGKVNYLAAGGYGYLFFSIDKENINHYWRDV